jgi:hypothetical protein
VENLDRKQSTVTRLGQRRNPQPNVTSDLARESQKQIITKGESGTRAACQNTRKLFEINILTSNP